MGGGNSLRWVMVLLGAGVATPGLTQTPVVEISVPEGLPSYQVVPPGGSGDFGIDLRDNSGIARLTAAFGYVDSPESVLSEYRFVSLEPTRCPVPAWMGFNPSGIEWGVFPDPIPAQTMLACRYRVERLESSLNELGLRFCVGEALTQSNCTPVARFGSFVDLDLSLEPLGPWSGDPQVQRVRVVLNNRSSRAVASRIAGTGCHGFDNPSVSTTAFDIVSPPGGGCTPVVTGSCGPGLQKRSYRLGPVAESASASCELHVRSMSRVGTRQVAFAFEDDRVALVGGRRTFDPDRRNGSALIGLDLQLAATPVPVGPRGPLIPGGALWLAGLAFACGRGLR